MSALHLPSTLLFDVDGTLIDSNDAHAASWRDALREHGVSVDTTDVRRMIGMGGDKLLRALGIDEGSELGQRISRRKKALFAALLPGLHATPGARALLEELRRRQVTLVIATSADDQEVAALTKQAGIADLIPTKASKDDAKESKPDPDIIHAALKKAGVRPEDALLVGDTPYDIEAARQAGVASVVLRCGGFWPDGAFSGASAIYDDPAAFLDSLRESNG